MLATPLGLFMVASVYLFNPPINTEVLQLFAVPALLCRFWQSRAGLGLTLGLYVCAMRLSRICNCNCECKNCRSNLSLVSQIVEIGWLVKIERRSTFCRIQAATDVLRMLCASLCGEQSVLIHAKLAEISPASRPDLLKCSRIRLAPLPMQCRRS